ncbi:MAG: FecR family protein, partial [Advenella sp.]|uniref:FecR family protein n=1 Tax=Advenella sp. TaxID=1872388 RepID=UPI003F965E20
DWRLFDRWRHANPEHDRQYCHVQHIWDATLQIPESELRQILARRETPISYPDLGRRRFSWWGVVGIGSAALVCGFAFNRDWFASPLQSIQITSLRGEQRQLTLPEGSMLNINTGTRAVVRLYEDRREVELLEGEIFFSVQQDPDRPFIVDAGNSRIVVTGTRFNVRYDDQTTRVSVASGSVEISSGTWWNRQSHSLSKGQGVNLAEGHELADVEHLDLDNVLAWQRGKIVFENTSLAQAVSEINRYLDRPARLDAPELREYRIAGIFSVSDPQSLIDMLPQFAPVRVYRLHDGQTRIVAK